MRNITEIFVHCAATSSEWLEGKPIEDKIKEIDRWHKARGWKGIGYHIICDRSGEIGYGRPLEEVGAHAQGHNSNSIGICLIGGKGSNENDKFDQHYTKEQKEALLSQLKLLTSRFPHATIRGHNEVASKACPGFNVKDFLDESGFFENHDEDVQERSSSRPSSGSNAIADLLGWLLSRISG